MPLLVLPAVAALTCLSTALPSLVVHLKSAFCPSRIAVGVTDTDGLFTLLVADQNNHLPTKK